MKKLLTIFFCFILASAHAQWWQNSGGNTYNTVTGNVGINTTTPAFNLEIQGLNQNNANTTLRVTNTGAPGSAIIENWASGVNGFFESTITPVVGTRLGSRSNYDLFFASNNVNRMILKTNGNMGINTLTPGYQLDVNGIINATGLYINGAPFSGGSSQWGNSSSNIYFNTGNVGIGTSTPGAKLEVNGDISLPSNTGNKQIYTWSASDPNWRIGMSATPGFTTSMATSHVQYASYSAGLGQGFAVGVNGGNSSFEITGSNHNAFFRGNLGIGTTTPDGLQVNNSLTQESSLGVNNVRLGVLGGTPRLILDNTGYTPFEIDNSGGQLRFYTPNSVKMVVNNNGNVGIGTTTPSTKLHVNGSGTYNVDLTVNGRIQTGDASGYGGIWLNNPGTMFLGQVNGNTLGLYNNGDWGMVLDQNRNLGIGNSTPSAKLDVTGTIKINDGTQALGKVLTSDANGLATWATPNYSQWSTSAANISFNAGNVGIGNTAPAAKLDITGTFRIADGTQGAGKVLTSDANGLATWAAPSGWTISGNSGTNSATNFIGTTDNKPLNFRVSNVNAGTIDANSASTAFGYNSLASKSIGVNNASFGSFTLYSTTSGCQNTAIGTSSLQYNTTGSNNTAIGISSLIHNLTGSYNTAIGYFSGPSSPNSGLSNITAIGNGATPTASNTIVLGNSSITRIGGQVSWSTLSDGRFKTNVKEDVLGLEFIKKLRPVTYTVDTEALDKFTGAADKIKDSNSQSSMAINTVVTTAKAAPVRQTGLVAQEVESVLMSSGQAFSGLVAPQNENDHYSIRYSDFVVPLVKAVQELSNQMQAQNKKIDSLQIVINALKNQVNPGKATGRLQESEAILNQNFPNPFSVDTQITMTVPATAQQASLIIYNLQGTQLKSILITERGNVSTKIIEGEMAAGMYLYSLIVDNQLIDTKRMILTN